MTEADILANHMRDKKNLYMTDYTSDFTESHLIIRQSVYI